MPRRRLSRRNQAIRGRAGGCGSTRVLVEARSYLPKINTTKILGFEYRNFVYHHTASRKEEIMNQRLYWFRVLAAVLAALIVSESATAGKQVPFKGRSSGIVTAVGFDPVKGIAYTHLEGSGEATHLGHFTVTGDVAVEVATGIPTGTWTLTAANGDMLFLEMTGSGIDPTHGFGDFTVVGGTGRFAEATGSYEQIITFALPLGTADSIPYTDVLEGTISSGNRS